MGGGVPLGYNRINHRLVVNQAEAETVREIFRRYLRLGCVSKLRDYLARHRICSKLRSNSEGQTSGGVPYGRGALYHLLRTRLGGPWARTMWSFTFCWRVMAGLLQQPVGARCSRLRWRSERISLEESLPVRRFVR